jgi:hypothetical protein
MAIGGNVVGVSAAPLMSLTELEGMCANWLVCCGDVGLYLVNRTVSNPIALYFFALH